MCLKCLYNILVSLVIRMGSLGKSRVPAMQISCFLRPPSPLPSLAPSLPCGTLKSAFKTESLFLCSPPCFSLILPDCEKHNKAKKILFSVLPFYKLFFWKPQPCIPAEVFGGLKNINQFRSWRPRLSSGKTFYIKQIVLCPCQGRLRFKLNMQQAAVG